MCIWVILVVTFYSITHFIVLYVCGSLKVLELKDWSCQQPFLNANMRMCTLDKVVSGLYFDMVCQVRLGFDQCDVCVCVCYTHFILLACHRWCLCVLFLRRSMEW